MENNLENKAKFFALYWGQNIIRVKGNTSKMKVSPIYIKPSLLKVGSYLELNSPLTIDKNDAKDMINLYMVDTDYNIDSEEYEYYSKKIIKFMLCYNGDITIKGAKFWKELQRRTGDIVDFLRSKGYALPWMGISVEKQIEYGWIKLKDNA